MELKLKATKWNWNWKKESEFTSTSFSFKSDLIFSVKHWHADLPFTVRVVVLQGEVVAGRI